MAHQAFVWKNGRGFNVAAAVVQEHIEQIQRRDGDCSAHALVDAARPESSQLHSLFEWNDEIAGEKWRVSQARTVICSIREADDLARPVYVSARVVTIDEESDGPDAEEERGYRSISVIQLLPEDRRSWLLREFKNISGALERVKAEPEFTPLLDALALVEAAIMAGELIAA